MSTQNDVEPSETLAAAGVDASVLFPSQLHLFKHAPPDQQLRLVELWRIAPPTYGQQMLAKNLGNWPQTSMEQEEEAAKHRWERMSEPERLRNVQINEIKSHAEPYIVNGYGSLPNINGMTAPTEHAPPIDVERTTEYNRANDPVYESREWWRHVSENQPIEYQYGLLQQRIDGYGPVDMDGDKEMY